MTDFLSGEPASPPRAPAPAAEPDTWGAPLSPDSLSHYFSAIASPAPSAPTNSSTEGATVLATPAAADGITGIDDRAASAICGTATHDDTAFSDSYVGSGGGGKNDDVFTPWPSPPPPTMATTTAVNAQKPHIFGRLKAEFTRVVAGGLAREKSNSSLSGGGAQAEEDDAQAPASVIIDKLKQFSSRVVGRTSSTDETEASAP